MEKYKFYYGQGALLQAVRDIDAGNIIHLCDKNLEEGLEEFYCLQEYLPKDYPKDMIIFVYNRNPAPGIIPKIKQDSSTLGRFDFIRCP